MLGFTGEFPVDVQGLGIMGHGTEQEIVRFGNGSMGHMLEYHVYLQLFEVFPSHAAAPASKISLNMGVKC